ncbi:hypothetical protein [Metabacillus niabensis]|uniref:YtzI protein n=1 Tax=Metabacillus niabensis TaxID=324854 RepID=A0ABT9Z2L9_9BACI|nr:hypothetical protein [Metabacillus niabensis]MDQ0226497.1 hypothetical protein [Metabacillus niabensis]
MIKMWLFILCLIGLLFISILLVLMLLKIALKTEDTSRIDPIPNDDDYEKH